MPFISPLFLCEYSSTVVSHYKFVYDAIRNIYSICDAVCRENVFIIFFCFVCADRFLPIADHFITMRCAIELYMIPRICIVLSHGYNMLWIESGCAHTSIRQTSAMAPTPQFILNAIRHHSSSIITSSIPVLLCIASSKEWHQTRRHTSKISRSRCRIYQKKKENRKL